MATVVKRFPREFRNDVVRVARKYDAPRAQIARDFVISDATVYEWLKKADVEDGVRSSLSEADAKEMRDLKRRNGVPEQEVKILCPARSIVVLDRRWGP